MSGGRILVVGSLHYDILVRSPKLPSIDETVLGGELGFACGGKGGNQAVAASCHGADVAFAGMIGADQFGGILAQNLIDHGVDVWRLGMTNHAASGASVAIIEHTGDYRAVVASGANQLIDASLIDIPGDVSHLLLQNEIPEDANLVAASRAAAVGAKVILNAAPWRPFTTSLLSLVSILIVNRVEFAGLAGRAFESAREVEVYLRSCTHDVSQIVVTLGSHGLVHRSGRALPRTMSAYPARVLSSHGAGDAFIGALCSELVRPCKLDRFDTALRYASAAAALHVSTPVEERASIGRDQVLSILADEAKP